MSAAGSYILNKRKIFVSAVKRTAEYLYRTVLVNGGIYTELTILVPAPRVNSTVACLGENVMLTRVYLMNTL